MGLDDPLHPLEIAGEEGTKGFGIDGFAERGRAGDVTEENGDALALLACGRGRRQRRAAIGTERKGRVDVLAAA
jgi:hypothetical protein